MLKTGTLLLAALGGALALTPGAWANALVDHDGDGRVSRVEYRTIVAQIARAADTDGNGLITSAEFSFTQADLALFDNDGDGQIASVSIQEFIDGMDIAFDAMDGDLDGYLSAAELEAANGRYGIAAPARPGG